MAGKNFKALQKEIQILLKNLFNIILGGLLAANRKYFLDVGGYDDKMEIW